MATLKTLRNVARDMNKADIDNRLGAVKIKQSKSDLKNAVDGWIHALCDFVEEAPDSALIVYAGLGADTKAFIKEAGYKLEQLINKARKQERDDIQQALLDEENEDQMCILEKGAVCHGCGDCENGVTKHDPSTPSADTKAQDGTMVTVNDLEEKGHTKKARMVFLKDLVDEGCYTQKEILAHMMGTFQHVKKITLQTDIADAKNPKYCPWGPANYVVKREDGTLGFI